jgi:hypothetical protein
MKLTNGTIEVDIADAIGPRIAAFRRLGEQSMFGDGAGVTVATPHGRWSAYGGHRMWLAPETLAETYRIDDAAPRIDAAGALAATAHHAGDARGFATSLRVELDPAGSGVTVTHVARNEGTTTWTVAPWALTIVRPGGTFVIPQPPRRTHAESLQPAATLALWAYAAFDDPRVTWSRDAIAVRCDPDRPTPWKIGASGEAGWCAYVCDGVAFVKRFAFVPSAAYPDRGCAVEAFTDGGFGELETLGPLAVVAPGEHVEHVERWSLVAVPATGSIADVVAAIAS